MIACARRRPHRLLLALGLVICGLAAAPAAARAGTYDVVACDAAPGGANNSWTAGASPAMTAGTACPTAQAPARGMWATAKVDAGTAAGFAAATQSFDAPTGASIVSLKAQFSVHRKVNYWGVGIFADGKMVLGCPANVNDFCLWTTAWPGTAQTFAFPQGVHRVYAQTTCGSATGCATGPPDVYPLFDRAGVRLYAATVRIRDDSAPAVWDNHEGALTNGAWQSGSHLLGYAASDNVGIRLTRFFVDGRQRDNIDVACDFTRRVPCPDLPSKRYSLDTQSLADGTHELRVQAVDPAGNSGWLTEQFSTDNTAPDPPGAVTVEGGEGWRAVNGFRLGWDNPASAAPITVAHYELCNTSTAECTEGRQRGDGIHALADVAVPAPGDYTARVWLEDAAGNVNPASASIPVHLRFDDAAPGRAEPQDHAGWLNARQADAFDELLRLAPGALVPVSGVGGYSVTTDGSVPDETIDSDGDTLHLEQLPEGATTIRARAISGAGVPSTQVGETRLRVDRTPPTIDATGAPDPAAWQRIPVTLRLSGSDQASLSGMTAALPEDPVEEGGHVAYRVDGGPVQRRRGATADATVASEGEHALTFRAVDAAGNESPEQTVRFRIDRTPPELVVFEMPDPADPRAIRVAAADRGSGVARAVVEVRRAGSARPWTPLATRSAGGRFVAQVDDAALAGHYELRARVADRAGNEAVGDRRRNGSPAIVNASGLRATTRLAVGIVAPPARSGSLRSAATVRFGKAATARGTLLRAGGAPVARALVRVYSRAASAGARFAALGRLRTDAAGAFSYPVRPGSSRTLRFSYLGSAVDRPASRDVVVRVPAAATIRASRRSVRNGQTVTFSGRLLGRPLPPGGKVVDLQAFYRGRWRTFATPRADRSGRWRYTYRFGATRGRLRYRFRVVVRRESAYPYELGHSRTTAVTVRG